MNDISALEVMLRSAHLQLCINACHTEQKRGNPAIMQTNTAYADVFAEVDGTLHRGRHSQKA